MILGFLPENADGFVSPKTHPLVLGGGDTLLKHMSIGIRKFHLLGLKIDEHRVSLEEPKNPWFIAGL